MGELMSEQPSEQLLEITAKDLVKKYRGRPVVNGISLEVRQGEVVGLLGPNGAGKTTTFYMIVGLIKPHRGQVLLDARDITRQPMYKRARAGISYLPQEPSVFRNLTVEENIHLVLQMMPLSRSQRKQRADQLMEQLHVTEQRHQVARTLSGGQRRRVEIARSLASNPKFILLDEPFTGVDPKAIEDIEDIIISLTRFEDKIGILITDHNVEAMLRITQRAYIVADGQVRVQGASNTLMFDPEARRAYFGERFGNPRDYAQEAVDAEARRQAEAELRRASGEWDELEEEGKGKREKGKEKAPEHLNTEHLSNSNSDLDSKPDEKENNP